MVERHRRFAQEYCKDFNASAAYRRVYDCEPLSAASSGSDLLRNPNVQKLIEERKAELAAVAELTPEWVLSRWLAIARADPRELTELIIFPCSDCWQDVSHGEKWFPLGYDAKTVRPDCERCKGEGIERPKFNDTRTLSKNAAALFAGVKATRNGVEIKVHSQTDALQNIANYMGMLKSRQEISGPNGAPIAVDTAVTAKELTNAQLAEIASRGLESS